MGCFINIVFVGMFQCDLGRYKHTLELKKKLCINQCFSQFLIGPRGEIWDFDGVFISQGLLKGDILPLFVKCDKQEDELYVPEKHGLKEINKN